MESSVRGDGDEATKGVDSFLDGANMSLASFEPSIQITNDGAIEPSAPTHERRNATPGDLINEAETRTPPLTIADLAAPPRKPGLGDDDLDSSPLARQTARRQPVSVIRRRPSSHRALSFRVPEDDDKFDVPEAILKKLDESDNEDSNGGVDNTKAEIEGNDTIGSLPVQPTQRRPSHGIGSLRPGSPSKSSMFQTPAAIRSTMNRLPTETAISQRIRDVEVPPSVMKELESDKRLLGLNERNDKSGVLTLREQGALIDKLRKENFGLKIKVFYLEGKINQQYDEAARDVMKENIELTRALKELTRTIAGYKRTINELEKRIAEAESKQQCNRRHYDEDDDSDNTPNLLQRAEMKEQLSAYESELEMLRRRDLERESELNRLRDLVRSISNGNVADGALNEYLDEERARKEDLEHENRELRDQLRRGVSTATTTAGGDEPANIVSLKIEIEGLRKESVAQTQVLQARNREREQLYAELEELKLQTMRNGRDPNTTLNGDSGHEECEATINELRDRLTEMRMANQDQRDDLESALRDLEQADQDKLDAQEDYQVEIDRLQEVIDQLVKENEELREAKDETERVADELDQEIESLVKEAQEKMAYQEREIRVRDEDLVAMKTDMQEALDKAYMDIESLEETVINKNGRIEHLRDQLQDIEEEHAKLLQKFEDNIQQGSRLQVQQEVSARELQFLREEADNSALKVADFQNLEKKLLDAERKLSRESARVRELANKVDVLEADKGKGDSEAEEKLKKQVEALTEELNNSKQELWGLIRKSSAREMDTKAMEKEISEGKRICIGVIGSDLDEALPLRKMIRRLVEELERSQLEVQELRHDLREEKKKLKDFQTLLEEMGAKTKQQKDGFDKERQLRKTALAQVSNLEASNKSMRQTLSEWEARIAEMQKSRANEQKALKQLEAQYKEQLTERNSLLATLWQRLGGIVGSKWVDKVNAQGGGGDVAPSTNFAGFSRNILQCVKVLEDVMVNFKLKCKGVERDLWNDYKNIDAKLENRTKRIMRLESLLRDNGKGDTELRAELAKVKAENRSLKSDYKEILSKSRAGQLRERDNRETPSPQRSAGTGSTVPATPSPLQASPSVDKRWLLRFQELETRLKAEQEGRALDQKGAKLRLDEVRKENAELRSEMKEKEATSGGSSSGSIRLSRDQAQDGNAS